MVPPSRKVPGPQRFAGKGCLRELLEPRLLDVPLQTVQREPGSTRGISMEEGEVVDREGAESREKEDERKRWGKKGGRGGGGYNG